jgi:glycosyltransferase involved in cell wall biosynthesis
VKARILHIQKAAGIAGAERHLLMLLEHLDHSRFTLEFLLLVDPADDASGYGRELERRQVRTMTVPIRMHIDPRCLMQVVRVIARGRYDIVHTHLIHGDVYGTVAARLAGVRRVVSTKHGFPDFDRPSRLYVVNGLLSGGVSRVITISDALAEKVREVERMKSSQMMTIHYGLDPQMVVDSEPDAVREQLGLDQATMLIVCVARMVPVKGLNYLIDAMAELSKRGSPCVLALIGDGPLRAALHQQAQTAGGGADIRFLGWRTDVAEFMRAADIVVLPTLGEGFGLVLLEAMAQCRPVVASDVTSIPEIVEDGRTGILVPPRSPRALADALQRLIANPELRRSMGAAGYERLRTRFSVARMVDATTRVYDELLAT